MKASQGRISIAALGCTQQLQSDETSIVRDPALPMSALVATQPSFAPAARGRALLEAHTILQVGDSTVGFLGGLQKSLDRRFTEHHQQFYSRSWTSASIVSVDESHELDDMLARFKPDLVIMNLGMNNVSWPHPEVLMNRVPQIVKRLTEGGRACVWIGPPSWKEDRGALVPLLADAVAPCVFFDSRDLELERQSDDIHPTDVGGEVWGEAVWHFLENDGHADEKFLP
jgi:lysophospholipase L1-like esterase